MCQCQPHKLPVAPIAALLNLNFTSGNSEINQPRRYAYQFSGHDAVVIEPPAKPIFNATPEVVEISAYINGIHLFHPFVHNG